ncbi:helix-turn-helix domain-containing protein [Actinomadura oligospora]|uniref:helix-turn-helix domain-containing protein n=1 Tax=Actinomadura oligospora TaxID=111804 RepID=UPI0004B3A1DC|nr:helix-turn-helix domain-containing protein [Actinomadura oligospora]
MMTVRALDKAPNLTKQLYKISEVMEILSMSRTVVYERMASGRLRYVMDGTVRRVPAAAITEYVARLEAAAAAQTAEGAI